MGVAQSKDASLDGLLELAHIVRASCRLRDERLHGGQGILDAMVKLVDQQFLLALRVLPFSDVDEHVDRARQISICIAQGRGKRRKPAPRSVWPFCDGFRSAN